jgi:hypothetical protein
MYEALCRPFGTTLDILHDEGGPPITQRTLGLGQETEMADIDHPTPQTAPRPS